MTSPYSRAQRERKPLQSLPMVKELRRSFRPRGPGGRRGVGPDALWAWAIEQTVYACELREIIKVGRNLGYCLPWPRDCKCGATCLGLCSLEQSSRILGILNGGIAYIFGGED